LANSVNLILSSTIENIRALTLSLKEVNEAIPNELKAFPNTLESVKGLGPVYSAGIFSEIGNIKPRFCIRNQVLIGKGALKSTSLLNKPSNQTLLCMAIESFNTFFLPLLAIHPPNAKHLNLIVDKVC